MSCMSIFKELFQDLLTTVLDRVDKTISKMLICTYILSLAITSTWADDHKKLSEKFVVFTLFFTI